MLQKIKNLFKRKPSYEEQRIEYLYHLVLAIARFNAIHPSKLAQMNKEITKNIIYLNEVFKNENEEQKK